MSQVARIREGALSLTFERDRVSLVSSFNQNLAFVGFGGYVYPSTDIHLRAEVTYTEADFSNETLLAEKRCPAGRWSKFGVHSLFDITQLPSAVGKLTARLELMSDAEITEVNFFGFELDAVRYYEDKDLWKIFQQKTRIYLPEIYYFDLDESFGIKPNEYPDSQFLPGRCVVLKSCNRCERYLLIDIDNERTALSFSNHCISTAPCTHSTFCKYEVVENNCGTIPDYIASRAVSDEGQSTLASRPTLVSHIRTHYGYQLECRSCKKFYVNAPLNPMRDSTQHREDSLRRRALEVVVDQLLDREWIYHSWRLTKDEGFDVHIWRKFRKRCFNCMKYLRSTNAMHLDHTMPLAFLWPLDESATCLCKTCNSEKRDKFPVDFYEDSKLTQLSKMTGLDGRLVRSRSVNEKALSKLRERVVWFFDEFLMSTDYQKLRRGKRAADLIYKAVEAAIRASGVDLNLVAEYRRLTTKYPRSITAD